MPRRPPDPFLSKGEPSTTLEIDCSSLSLVPTGFPAGKDSGHLLLHPSKNPNSSKQGLWGAGYKAGSPAPQIYKSSMSRG